MNRHDRIEILLQLTGFQGFNIRVSKRIRSERTVVLCNDLQNSIEQIVQKARFSTLRNDPRIGHEQNDHPQTHTAHFHDWIGCDREICKARSSFHWNVHGLEQCHNSRLGKFVYEAIWGYSGEQKRKEKLPIPLRRIFVTFLLHFEKKWVVWYIHFA